MGCNLFEGIGCRRNYDYDEYPWRRPYPPRRNLYPGWDRRNGYRDRDCPRCRSIFPRLF